MYSFDNIARLYGEIVTLQERVDMEKKSFESLLDKTSYLIENVNNINNITNDLTNIQNRLDQYQNNLKNTIQNIDLSKIKKDIESFIDSVNQSIIKDNQLIKDKLSENKTNAFSIFQQLQNETIILRELKEEINTTFDKKLDRMEKLTNLQFYIVGIFMLGYIFFKFGQSNGWF